jgi:hypothetical protein
MYVMVVGIVCEQKLAGVPCEPVTRMVVYRFYRADGKEEDGLTDGHARQLVRDDRAEGVEEERLGRVVVECAESVGDVEAVVDRVDVFVEEAVGVEEPVQEVLPCIEEEAGCQSRVCCKRGCDLQGKDELSRGYTPPVHPPH